MNSQHNYINFYLTLCKTPHVLALLNIQQVKNLFNGWDLSQTSIIVTHGTRSIYTLGILCIDDKCIGRLNTNGLPQEEKSSHMWCSIGLLTTKQLFSLIYSWPGFISHWPCSFHTPILQILSGRTHRESSSTGKNIYSLLSKAYAQTPHKPTLFLPLKKTKNTSMTIN